MCVSENNTFNNDSIKVQTKECSSEDQIRWQQLTAFYLQQILWNPLLLIMPWLILLVLKSLMYFVVFFFGYWQLIDRPLKDTTCSTDFGW